MSAKSRNFRRRGGNYDGDEDEESATTSNGPSSLKPVTSKPKKPPTQAPKLLSFADDEDDGDSISGAGSFAKSRNRPPKPSTAGKTSSSGSRAAKPTSAHTMTSLKDRVFHSSSASPLSHSLPSNVQPQAGTYTKEALRELQKNTRTLASSSRPSSEPVLVLKGLIKPTEAEKDANSSDSEQEAARGNGNDRDSAAKRMAAMGIGSVKGRDLDSAGSVIPNKAMIEAIRAKRERLRQSHAAAPDFISLDAGSNHGEAEGLSDEEPENLSRIAMLGEKSENSRKGVFEAFDERATAVHEVVAEEEVNEEDEEEKIWEAEQFRKGLGKNRVDDSGVVAVPVAQQSVSRAAVGSPNIGGAHGGLSQGLGSGLMSISQQGEIAKKAILDSARRLKESHGRTVSLLAKTDENLSASLINITALEKSLSIADEKYQFLQKIRDFVSIICGFLQHKAPFIEELEDQIQKLHENRASAIVERRFADNDDEMTEVEAEVNAVVSVFNQRGGGSDAVAAAKNAAQAASAAFRELANLPVKLDELGRDMNLQNRMAMKRRAEIRRRRKARFDSKRQSSMDIDSPNLRVEGESSTDESDSEKRAFRSHRDLLLETAAHIFSDASEEYSQLSVVKETFETWKRDYLSAYKDAYMSLSVPSLFSPYVRLELLKWDPLRERTDFMKMNWHSLLMDYGLPKDGNSFALGDTDANLVPELVEKVALPILHHEVVQCWDTLSTHETENAVAAISLVTDYVPASSEALADVLVALRTRLADAVASLTVPTWSPLVLQAVADAPRIAAYRFGRAVRLMRNICLWKEILASPVLEKLALDDLLCGKVLPHLRSIAPNIHDAVTRTERVVTSLLGVWCGPSATVDRNRKLQPLVDYVLLLGKLLEKKHALTMSESETSGLARRLKKMLVDLNEYDNGRHIARTFHLKEAL